MSQCGLLYFFLAIFMQINFAQFTLNDSQIGFGHKMKIWQNQNHPMIKGMWASDEGIARLSRNLNARAIHLTKKMAGNWDGNFGIHQMLEFDFLDFFYRSQITLGTPPQQFEVLLDTGSQFLWIPDKSCQLGGCAFRNSAKFDAALSFTYVPREMPFSAQYVTDSVSGFQGQDILRLGPIYDANALTIPGVVFGQVNLKDSGGVRPMWMEGILGLAMGPIVNGIEPPMLTAFLKQCLQPLPMFTIYLATEGAVLHEPGGVITFGAFDAEHCAPILGWVPLTSPMGVYQFQIDGIAHGNIILGSGVAISDSGTALILGDPVLVAVLASEIGAIFDKRSNVYRINCRAEIEPIILLIGGRKYPLGKNVLFFDDGNHQMCLFGIAPFPRPLIGVQWILGDPFIRAYCNIYDIGRRMIGFAPAIWYRK